MDGARIEQGPGEFSFGEDQGCTETAGKKGHRSGTIGDEPCCLMTVQTPCRSKTRAMPPDMIFQGSQAFGWLPLIPRGWPPFIEQSVSTSAQRRPFPLTT